jgi:preprotein translocase subunit YajC
MIWNSAQYLLALAPPTGGGSGQQSGAPWYVQLFPFFILIFVFYFLLIRPQQRKAKEHANLLKAIKKGDRIVTSSGIIATVISVQEKTLSIRSADTKLEILKSAVSDITERSGES